MIDAGFPATTANGGTSRATTAPAPTTAPFPIVTPETNHGTHANPDVVPDRDVALASGGARLCLHQEDRSGSHQRRCGHPINVMFATLARFVCPSGDGAVGTDPQLG